MEDRVMDTTASSQLRNGDLIFAHRATHQGQVITDVPCRIAIALSVKPMMFSADLSSGHPVQVLADNIRLLTQQERESVVPLFEQAMRG
jgi:hypothetical protein